MFSVSPEIYSVLSDASRWLFAFFALMLLLFALGWHRSDRKERRDRFMNLPGAGTVGELVVISGSDRLPQDTWFPVPREGVLGSLRSCDLVVPCPGGAVRDGVGAFDHFFNCLIGRFSSFVDFIGDNMRLDPVKLAEEESIPDIMEFYMGDNTGERQHFIMENLRSEEELEDVNI